MMMINGVKVEVRMSLEQAIRAFTDKKALKHGMPLWADVLCMNQDDLKERH